MKPEGREAPEPELGTSKGTFKGSVHPNHDKKNPHFFISTFEFVKKLASQWTENSKTDFKHTEHTTGETGFGLCCTSCVRVC